MSKRKRVTKSSTGANQPAGDESTTSAADDAPTEDMAHVSPDLLSGSPDIFAPKWTEEPPAATAPEAVAEPAAPEAAAEPVESEATTAESVATPAEPEPTLAPPASTSPPPPHYVAPTVRPA